MNEQTLIDEKVRHIKPGVQVRLIGGNRHKFTVSNHAFIDPYSGNWMMLVDGGHVALPVKDFEVVDDSTNYGITFEPRCDLFKKGNLIKIKGCQSELYTVSGSPYWNAMTHQWMVPLVNNGAEFIDNCELHAVVTPPPAQLVRPPLGIKPRYLVDTERAQELLDGMIHYVESNPPLRIPDDWIHELQEINDRTKPKI